MPLGIKINMKIKIFDNFLNNEDFKDLCCLKLEKIKKNEIKVYGNRIDKFGDIKNSIIPINLLKKIHSAIEVEWIYQSASNKGIEPANTIAENNTKLSGEQVASLLDLGRTGHVSALQKKLCELELENPESAEFIALLRNELDNFDLTNFLQLLSNNEVENDSR